MEERKRLMRGKEGNDGEEFIRKLLIGKSLVFRGLKFTHFFFYYCDYYFFL